MKNFLKNIALLALLLLLVTAIVECLLLYRPNPYSYKRDYVEKNIKEIKCLFLGNSHIEEGVNPSLLGDGAFNMAMVGRHMEYDVELAKRYVPQMDSLKAVFIQLNYGFFYFGRESDNPKELKKKENKGFNLTRKCMYSKYMGIHVDGLIGYLYNSEFLCSKQDFMSRFVKDSTEAIGCDSLGYVPLKLSKRVPQWKYMALPKLVDTSKKPNQKRQDLLYRQYSSIAQLTKENNVRFILLGTPFSKTYQQMMNPEVQTEIDAFVSRLQKDFPNVEYYNYNGDERFGENDFCDASHLSDVGAAKFSRILRDEVLNR